MSPVGCQIHPDVKAIELYSISLVNAQGMHHSLRIRAQGRSIRVLYAAVRCKWVWVGVGRCISVFLSSGDD